MNKPVFTKLGLIAGMVSILALPACSTMDSLWSDDNVPAEQPSQAAEKKVSEATMPFKASGIRVAWRTDVDQRLPSTVPGFSLPGLYVSGDQQKIIAGAQDKRVRLYSTSGSEEKRIGLDAACESGMLQLANGLVVLGDIEGGIYGLDFATGTRSWKVEISSSLIGRPVAVDQGFIIQTVDNQVYRFTANGEKLWSFSGSLGGLGMHLSPTPVVYEDRVYAAMSNGEVVALKAENGSFVWKRQLLLDTGATVLSELTVPVATPTVIPAANSGRGEDVLIVPVFQGELTSISLLDGSTINTRQISLKSGGLLDGRQLFVADATGAVSALDVADGHTLWKQKVSSTELTGPVLWQGDLWVADEQARVYRLNRDGTLKASIELSGRIDRAPVAASNGVLVRNNRGTLYLLN